MRRVIRAGVLVVIAAAGCTTTEEAVRRDMSGWIGQPVRSFAERHSIVPDGVNPTAEGRTYIFRMPGALGGSCGVTIWAVASGVEYVISNMSTFCPPHLIQRP